MKKNLLKIHDRAFRGAMSDMRVAHDFLEHYLPLAVKKKVDLSTLQICQESYIDEELKELVTDMLYSVEWKNKPYAEKTYIYLLCEHLSNPQPLTSWRMVKYTCQIVEQKLKESKSNQLPLVIPLVIYNGSKPFPFSTSLYDLFNEEKKSLAQAYMFNHFQLIDFSQVPDEEIRTHHWSTLMELLMKHARSRNLMNYLESLASDIYMLSRQNAEQYILVMLKYVIESTKIQDKERFTKFLHKSLPKSLEERAMTLAQLWHKEGFEQGIEKGIEKGIEQGLIQGQLQERSAIAKKLLQSATTIELIQQITGFSLAEIKDLEKV